MMLKIKLEHQKVCTMFPYFTFQIWTYMNHPLDKEKILFRDVRSFWADD